MLMLLSDKATVACVSTDLELELPCRDAGDLHKVCGGVARFREQDDIAVGVGQA